jgi:carboxypeptidase C (cathepsin A)
MAAKDRLFQILAICCLVGGSLSGAFAQAGPPAQDEQASPSTSSRSVERSPSSSAFGRLPSDVTTNQSVRLSGRTLNFRATAGTIKLTDEKGAEQADIAFIAYQLDGVKSPNRPVTFVFNGGPGAGSVWLNLGALGPWRLPLNPAYPSSSPTLLNNDDTWLDFTDLVFIDPAGTGYSQIVASNDEVRKHLWSVEGDIESLAAVVRRWLTANGRLASPKFIVGESYGGFRAPRLAEELATRRGVGVSGLVLISPALDFSTLGGVDQPFTSAILLPSYAAAMMERTEPVTRQQLSGVEQYASGDYLLDYLRGPRDAAAVTRMADRVASLTGLDRALVKRLGGRIDKRTFLREFDRSSGKVGANYDVTIQAYDPDPTSSSSRWLDPVTDGFIAPLTSAITDLYATRLGWKIDNSYETLNYRVNRAWDWGGALDPPNATSALRKMLALDPNFRVLVTHGLTDVQVPYFGTKLLLDQIPDYGASGRITFDVLPGGHMHYTRDDSRKALREDARVLIERN